MPAIHSEIIVVCFVVLGGYFIFTAPHQYGRYRERVRDDPGSGGDPRPSVADNDGREYAAYQREVGFLIPLPPRRSVRPADEHDRTGRPA